MMHIYLFIFTKKSNLASSCELLEYAYLQYLTMVHGK